MQHGPLPGVLVSARTAGRTASTGFTTIELLAAAGITLVILAVASTFYTGQQRMLLVQSAYAQSQNVTRTFSDLFSREVRMASYDPTGAAIAMGPSGTGVTCPSVRQGITEAAATSLRFRQDLNGDGDVADANENVRYYLSGAQILRQDGDGTALVLVDGVPNGGLAFSYFNAGNPPAELTDYQGSPPALTASARDCIAKVRVRLTAQLANPQFYDIQPLMSSIDTEIAVRNRSLMNF
jgi:hypothetical protein